MLYGWMKSLIIYLILSGIVVNLSPGKNYRQYINFFTGLIVIIILANPLAYLFNISQGDISGMLGNMEEYAGIGDKYKEDNEISNYFEMGVSSGIMYSLKNAGFYIDDVKVITDDNNNILRCTVYLTVTDNENISDDDIKKYINDVYNVETDSIYIVRR